MSLHLSLHLSGLLPEQRTDPQPRAVPAGRTPRPATPLAVAEQVRPALVLLERQGRALRAAAVREDVTRGGCLSAGPAGVQVWSRPFDGPDATPGSAELLGSVDWTYDAPVRHHLTVYRVVVTVAGAARGLQAAALLDRVLRTAGVDRTEVQATTLPAPLPRDPFRAAQRRQQP